MTQQANRVQLEQIIAGLAEGVLLVETDQSITYANEAALAMHGVGTLSELGETVDAYRERFVLRYRNNHLIRPGAYPIERFLAGETCDDVVVEVCRRTDPQQDWTHRIRSFVVTERNGEPDFLVLIITDVSDQFEAEDRFEKTFAANPAPAVICRLADQRFVKVNEGFLELTGLDRATVLGRTLYDLDVLQGATRRDLALERLRAGQTIPQMEADLPVTGGQRHVLVAGQPLEVADAPCMLFTFADLEAHRAATKALRASDERFVKCFRLAPIPLSLAVLPEGRILDVNEAFCAATGYERAAAVGASVAELSLFADPETAKTFHAAIAEDGRARGVEATLRRRDGGEFVALLSGDALEVDGEACVVCAFQDISQRKRSEAELLRAIDAVMQDATWFGQAVVEKLAALRGPTAPNGRSSASSAAVDELTAREREMLGFICGGEPDAAIAGALGISVHTVRNHVAALYKKIGVNRRAAAIIWARERGIEARGS